eukprot:scaffold1306_cov399-Prasinococcus_capsulatus_cf.AAC.9
MGVEEETVTTSEPTVEPALPVEEVPAAEPPATVVEEATVPEGEDHGPQARPPYIQRGAGIIKFGGQTATAS